MSLPEFALSVRQPWAWAIVEGVKPVENRSPGAVRHGMDARPLAIHAAKGMTQSEYIYARNFMCDQGVRCPVPAELVRGAVIGAADVTEVVSAHPSPWFFGPRGLVLARPRGVAPIACSGALGYFRWTPGGTIAAPMKWMIDWVPPCSDGVAADTSTTPLPLFDAQGANDIRMTRGSHG